MVKKNTLVRNISIIIVTLMLMGLIVFLVGRSFGFFQYAKKGDTVNVVTINGLDVNITNDSEDNLNLQEAYPMYDADGLSQSPLTFTVENTSARAIDYTLKVENDTEKQAACKLENNDPCPALSTSNIKYAYKVGNGEYSQPQNLGTSSNIILTTTILGGQTQSISLILWIDSNAGNEIQGQYFFGQLIIEGTKSLGANVTLYSAASDTVYYYANNDTTTTPINLGTTDATGKLENVFVENGVKYYSSVAKQPEDQTKPYSREYQNINDSVYLMPEGTVLYWYGYKSSDIGPMSDWTWSSYPYANNVTYNTNSVRVGSTSSTFSGVAYNTAIPVGTNINVIVKGITEVTTPAASAYGSIVASASKNVGSRDIVLAVFTNSVTLLRDTTTVDNDYVALGNAVGRVMDVYAWWLD